MTLSGGVGVSNEYCKAGEGHPCEDQKADVHVDVEHWGDAVQDYLTWDTSQIPGQTPGKIGCEEWHDDGHQQVGNAQMG